MSLKKYKKKENVELVTDQPGRQILFVGILIAITLGFILRGLTSSQVIHQKLQEATKSLGGTTTISWSQAQFSFRSGIFIPQLSVRVQNVKVVSFEPCWGEPILFTKEVELPLSITGWISHGQPLQSLILKESFLEIRSSFKCDKPLVKNTDEKALPAVVKSVRMKSKSEGVSRPPVVINDFQFEGLKVRNSQWTLSDWSLKNFRVQVQENQPWYVTLTSNFVIPETDGVDSNVGLKMVYKEFPSPLVDVSIKGHWREGNFNITGDWNQGQKSWNLKTQFNNFPFQFLKILANKTKTPWNWPDSPMWFSFISESSNTSADWQDSKHLLRNISIEGDLGELKTPDLRIESLKPFRVAPFVFNIDKADLNTSFQPQFRRIQEIQNLGFLTGQGEWISQSELRFRGQWSGSRWSLKSRVSQVSDFEVKDSTVQAQLVKGQWTINVLNPELNGQKVFGDVELKGPQNLRQGQLKTNLHSDTLPLLMVSGISLVGSQNFKILNEYKWDQKKSEETMLLTLSGLELDQVKFENLSVNLKKRMETTEIKSHAEKITLKKNWNPELEKLDLFKTLPVHLGYSTLQLKLEKNQLSNWNLVLPNLVSTGAVDLETQKLKGLVRYKNEKHNIGGTTTAPEILR